MPEKEKKPVFPDALEDMLQTQPLPPDFVPVQNPLHTRILTALPDFGIAAVFFITWLAPRTLGDRTVAYLMLVMLLEFIIVHSSGFMGSVMLNKPLSARMKIKALLGFGVFYALFAIGFSLGFQAWWPLWTIIVMTLNRMMIVLLGQMPDDQERAYIQRGWAVSALCYIVLVTVTIFLPLPRLGITRAEVVVQDLPGSGLWVNEPHRVIAFGFLYFLATGLSELYSHAWLKTVPPAQTDAPANANITDSSPS